MNAATDKELLELAAKAYGIALEWDDEGMSYYWENWRGLPQKVFWNSLGDDADALRLAVKTGEPFVVRTRCVTTMGGLKEDFDHFVPGDDLRATRRVITRAAAAMGKKP